MSTIVMTAPTGTIGARLRPLLLARGHTVATLSARHGEVPPRDLLAETLSGADAVFLACGNVPGQVDYEKSLIDAAARAGVGRLVKLSARGASLGSPVAYWHWHAQIEQHLEDSGLPATILQPGFLMTNLLAAADQVRATRMLFAPAGAAGIAMVDPDDVAEVAAALLASDEHVGGRQVLTGPEPLTYDDVAQALSAATGQHIGYADVPPEAARAGMLEAGLPEYAAEQVVHVFEALRHGSQATTTGRVQEITGRAPRTFADFAQRYADAFLAQSAPVSR